jgi:hypothetical protein
VVGNSRPFGVRAARVARAADALQERREAARRSELAHELDGPMSMPSSSDAVATSARARRRAALLDALSPVDGEAAVVRGDAIAAEPLAEQVRDALRLAARVREHERRAVQRDLAAISATTSPHCSIDADRRELAAGTQTARSSSRR